MFKIMYYGGLLIGIAGAVAMLFVFIKLDIYHSFMEISGLEAKLALKKMKEQKDTYSQESIKIADDKVTIERIIKKPMVKSDHVEETTLLVEQELNAITEILDDETTVLNMTLDFTIDEEFIDIHTKERII